MAKRKTIRRNPRARPPAFTPVKLRSRKDGWTPYKQCGFLAALYQTGSVAKAARAVGMSRETAYRLRAREGAESFAAAWDRVLRKPAPQSRETADWRKVTPSQLKWRSVIGLWRPVIHRGALRDIALKPDNSALLRLTARLAGRSVAAGEGGRTPPD